MKLQAEHTHHHADLHFLSAGFLFYRFVENDVKKDLNFPIDWISVLRLFHRRAASILFLAFVDDGIREWEKMSNAQEMIGEEKKRENIRRSRVGRQ